MPRTAFFLAASLACGCRCDLTVTKVTLDASALCVTPAGVASVNLTLEAEDAKCRDGYSKTPATRHSTTPEESTTPGRTKRAK